MKVSKLIRVLKKMPQNLEIYMADHDHGTYETNSIANNCELIDKSKMTDTDNDNAICTDGCFTHTPKKYVCIRP